MEEVHVVPRSFDRHGKRLGVAPEHTAGVDVLERFVPITQGRTKLTMEVEVVPTSCEV